MKYLLIMTYLLANGGGRTDVTATASADQCLALAATQYGYVDMQCLPNPAQPNSLMGE